MLPLQSFYIIFYTLCCLDNKNNTDFQFVGFCKSYTVHVYTGEAAQFINTVGGCQCCHDYSLSLALLHDSL